MENHRDARMVQHTPVTNAISGNKGQKCGTITTDVGKALDKIQFPFMIESLNEAGIEGMNLGVIKAILKRRPSLGILTSEMINVCAL